MTAVPDAPEEPEDLTSLLQQVAAEPGYSPADIAMVEERLTRFGVIVDEAYRSVECVPEPARLRK